MQGAQGVGGAGRTRRRVVALFVGVAAALVLAEATLRIAGDGAPPGPKIGVVDTVTGDLVLHAYPSDPANAFEPTPALTPGRHQAIELSEPPRKVALDALAATPWCVRYAYGSEGVRGPAVTPRPLPGVTRIALIGDSFAFGEGVREPETLAPRLAARLGASYEVPNCAQSGADLALDVARLEWAVASYGCTRALLVVTLNDVPPPTQRAAADRAFDLLNVRADDGTPAPLRWSRLAHLAFGFAAARARTAATEDEYAARWDPQRNGTRLDEAAALFARAAALPGCRTVVVVHPLLHRLRDYPFRAAHAEIAALARRAGLDVVDLLPAFEGLDERTLFVHPIDHHPNARAHALSAERLAAALLELPAFAPR